ncbi:hypothetical protein ScPMuIL_004986 [Solemya velum]
MTSYREILLLISCFYAFLIENKSSVKWKRKRNRLVSSGTLRTALFPKGNRHYPLFRGSVLGFLRGVERWNSCVSATSIRNGKMLFRN